MLYFAAFIVLDPGDTAFTKMQVITDREYHEAYEHGDVGSFRVGMGAEAIKELLQRIDLDALSQQLRTEIAELTEKERERETEG